MKPDYSTCGSVLVRESCEALLKRKYNLKIRLQAGFYIFSLLVNAWAMVD